MGLARRVLAGSGWVWRLVLAAGNGGGGVRGSPAWGTSRAGLEVRMNETELAAVVQRFCGREGGDWPYMLSKPFKRRQYVYATDGHVAIRVPAKLLPNVGKATKAPPADKLGYNNPKDPSRWFRLTLPPDDAPFETCFECEGEKKHLCGCVVCPLRGKPCPSCNGSGLASFRQERVIMIDAGGITARFNDLLVRKVPPGAEFRLSAPVALHFRLEPGIVGIVLGIEPGFNVDREAVECGVEFVD